MRTALSLLAAALIFNASATWAADAPATNLPESRWSDSAEIVVRPTVVTVPGRRCPAMWKLKRGQSTLYVLATLTTVPEGMTWDSSCFKKLLPGSNRLYLPDDSVSKYRPPDAFLAGNRSLGNAVSKRTYQRFAAAVDREYLPPGHFDIFKPQWAGAFLMGSVFGAHGLRDEAFPAYIPYLASAAKVPVQKIKGDGAGEKLSEMRNQLDAHQAEDCLNSYLDLIDYDLDVVPRMADAWGRGDMASVLRDYREIPRGKCLTPEGEAFKATIIKANVDAFTAPLDSALNQPGKSIAVIDLPDFLRADGVLDQLKAKGIDVIAPSGAEDTE